MRVAGKKRFFKIYGIINTPIKNGDEVTFQINANFYVKSFEGSKELAISTLSPYGYVKKNNVSVHIVPLLHLIIQQQQPPYNTRCGACTPHDPYKTENCVHVFFFNFEMPTTHHYTI